MTGHVFVYGYIGTGPGEASVKTVKAQLASGYDDYILHVASGGGDVFEGYAIYNTLLNTNKPITTQIEGVCASIATLVAAAGDTIVMNRVGQFMIHNPQAENLKGDARHLRNVANQLDQIKTLLISVYQKKTGLSKEKLWELYDNETWLTSQQAQQMGFVDEQVDAVKAVAKINVTMNENLFTKFLNWIRPKVTNQMTETIEGGELTGRNVIVMAEENEDWNQKQVVLDTGESLPGGSYNLASGKSITVDENGNITEYTMPTVENALPEEEMKKDEEIAALKAEIERMKSEGAAAAQNAAAEAVKNVQASFTNKLTEFEKKFAAVMGENERLKSVTVGDQTPVKRNPAFKNAMDNERYDPMGEHVLEYLKSRNAFE